MKKFEITMCILIGIMASFMVVGSLFVMMLKGCFDIEESICSESYPRLIVIFICSASLLYIYSNQLTKVLNREYEDEEEED